MFKNKILPIFSATIVISLSEFFRNEILFKSIWLNHYNQLGITFPSEPINGAVWGIWSLGLAFAIFYLSNHLKFKQTFIFSWFIGFVLMWIVIWNLSVLPIGILLYAIPLSILETFLATWVVYKLKK
ncbi:hypothetical protein EHQ23_15140 [Leptospira bourretii]|uniref:Uncharacterized protein n=1 Tax=Leptospira bourretii TaxID=2484962 RepID=A0A4R9IRV8_9LEPT|nr:hypothetical protein [Leptospira bourretii]TGK85949.1 hypothetical protein EHQ23_15140 [Leptospira bourretii]TGK94847.1 hypothetical protein EHQ26_02570 [Leptospira bourretii]TGL25200.1 hypothetical protein EHQ47_04500 [Leptospira bourretii]